MHPKLKMFLEAKKNQTEVLPGMDTEEKSDKKETEEKKDKPKANPKPKQKKKEDIESAKTIPAAPPAEPPAAPEAKDEDGGPPASAEPAQESEPPAAQPQPDDVVKLLQTVFQVNKGIVDDIQKMREYFEFVGAQLKSVQDDKMKYMEEEMKKFDHRIRVIETVVQGMVKQQSTQPPVA